MFSAYYLHWYFSLARPITVYEWWIDRKRSDLSKNICYLRWMMLFCSVEWLWGKVNWNGLQSGAHLCLAKLPNVFLHKQAGLEFAESFFSFRNISNSKTWNTYLYMDAILCYSWTQSVFVVMQSINAMIQFPVFRKGLENLMRFSHLIFFWKKTYQHHL